MSRRWLIDFSSAANLDPVVVWADEGFCILLLTASMYSLSLSSRFIGTTKSAAIGAATLETLENYNTRKYFLKSRIWAQKSLRMQRSAVQTQYMRFD